MKLYKVRTTANTIIITKKEFKELVDSGKAKSNTLHNRITGAITMYGHIEIDDKEYTQDKYVEKYGYSWQSTASGSVIFLMSENGDVLKVVQKR